MRQNRPAAPKVSGHPVTPDGRYFVVRGRLWRMSNPSLKADERDLLVKALMAARRAVALARQSQDKDAQDDAHEAVDRAKRDLGERGPVWWTDGAPDLNRHLARTGPYAEWFAKVDDTRLDPVADRSTSSPRS